MNKQAAKFDESEVARRRSTVRDGVAFLGCVIVATVLAASPHFATLRRNGTLDYLADGDDALYLSIARAPYWGESSVRDPFASPEDRVPSLYSWMQFVPIAKLARVLNIPLIYMPLLWRVVGGILFGASIYIFFRVLLSSTKRPTAWSLLCSLICLTDPGFVDGRCIVSSLALARQMIAGNVLLSKADALPQYRVVTPLLNLPFLLLFAASLFQTRSGRRLWVVAGALCLGLCFQLYFFFWTAAVAAGAFYGGLILAEYLMRRDDRPAVARELGLTALIVAGGLAIGGGQVYQNSKTFGDEATKPILERLSRGQKLDVSNPARHRYILNYWALGKLAIGAAAAIWLRSRAIALLWCFTAAGFSLVNSAVVTGLEFENFHWNYVYSSFGEACLSASLAFAVDRFEKIPRGFIVVGALVALTTSSIAFAWRPYEALHAPEAVWNSKVLEEIEPLRGALSELTINDVLAGPREVDIALVFSRSALLFHFPHSSHSSMIPDQEVHERHALNAWLLGYDRARYAEIAGDSRFSVGAAVKPEWKKEAVLAARLKLFDRIDADPRPFMKRYHPNVLLTRADAPKPTRGGSWRSIASSDAWTLWKRTDDR